LVVDEITFEVVEVIFNRWLYIDLFILHRSLLDHFVLGTRFLSGGGVEKASDGMLSHPCCLIFTAKLNQPFIEFLEI
jgi:hypothetical protein